MSSPEPTRTAPPEALPPALSSMWRLCKLGYRHEPGLLVAAFVLAMVSALPDALIAVWLKLLGEGVLRGDRGMLVGAAVGLAASSSCATRCSSSTTCTCRSSPPAAGSCGSR